MLILFVDYKHCLRKFDARIGEKGIEVARFKENN